VADAKPKKFSVGKLKKDKLQNIELEINPDLLKELSKSKLSSQVIIAFAAETGELDLLAAETKLREKGGDLLFLNDVSDGAIFGSEQTAGFIIDKSGTRIECETQSKDTLADLLLDQALNKLGSSND